MTLEDFEKQPFYTKFEQWVINMLVIDYYYDTFYDDDGNVISEAYTDEDGAKEAWLRAFAYGQLLYEANNPILYFQNIVKRESLKKQIQNTPKPDGMELAVAWATCFCVMIVDLDNFHNYKGGLLRKSIESCVSAAFREMEMEHEWLEFYVMMKSKDPYIHQQKLGSFKAMTYWVKLQQAGLINEEYQATWAKGMKNWHVYEIMTYMSFKIGCRRTILEKHFLTKKGKPNTNWRKEGVKHHVEDEIMRKIKSCFRD